MATNVIKKLAHMSDSDIRGMSKAEFADLMASARLIPSEKQEITTTEYRTGSGGKDKLFVLDHNGKILYSSMAGEPGAESIFERETRERFWKSFGKKIRKGSRV